MPDPKYRQIAGDLQRRIEAGDWPPGESLPTEPQLQDEYDASRNTIRDAVKWLITRGLVSTRPGRGTFVNEPIKRFRITLSVNPTTGFGGGEGESFIADVQAQEKAPRTTVPEVGIKKADDLIAGALRIDRDVAVVSRHQQRFIDDKPASLQTTFYPKAFADQGAEQLLTPEDIKPGVVAYLKRTLGIEQRYYQDAIEVRPPQKEEIDFFEIPDDGSVAVYVHYRIAYDTENRPFRLTVSVCPTDRHEFAMFFGDVPDDVASSDSAWFPGLQREQQREKQRSSKSGAGSASSPA